MAILLKCGATFLHIPKTGGSWVEKVLEDCDLIKAKFSHKHADMERVLNYPRHYTGNYIRQCLYFKKDIYEEIRDSYKFCFVRNPFQWYESYWRYCLKLEWRLPKIQNKTYPLYWHKRSVSLHPTELIIRNCKDQDFNKFMEKVVQSFPGFLTKLYGLYASHEIDFIGKQETLTDDLISILKKTKVDFDENKIRRVNKVNESKINGNTLSWNKEIRNEIYKLEYPIFFKYNYSIF